MGTWGPGSFENDQSINFVEDLLDSDDWEFVREALRAGAAKSLDACVAIDAIAASEIVAAAVGKPCADLPDGIDEWIADHPVPSLLSRLRASALEVVSAVIAQAPVLSEVWSRSPAGLEGFLEATRGLQERLKN